MRAFHLDGVLAHVKFDKNEIVAGQRLLRIRDMLQSVGSGGCALGSVAHDLDISYQRADAVIDELLSRGWLEPWKPNGRTVQPGFFSVTDAGRRLALFRAVPRVNREKADRLLAEFLKRCEEIDRRDELGWYVRQVRLFGSYLTTAEDLGDIDLHVELVQRPVEGRKPVEYSNLRADTSGRRLTFMQRLCFAEKEVWRILKARSAYVSLHAWCDLAAQREQSKVVFTSGRGFRSLKRSEETP